MKTSALISGIFVDQVADRHLFETPRVTDADIYNYLDGRYGLLTSQQIAFLKELQDDPDNTKWEAAHANWIRVKEEDFFEFLFVHFPASDSWEASYQKVRAIIRDLVGPRPIDYIGLRLVAGKLMSDWYDAHPDRLAEKIAAFWRNRRNGPAASTRNAN